MTKPCRHPYPGRRSGVEGEEIDILSEPRRQVVTRRTLGTLAVAGVAATATLAPAASAAPKTISKSYTVTAPVPVPLPAQGTPTCIDGVEGLSKRTETLKAPAAGTLKVELTGFQGDWDITIFDDKNKPLVAGGGTSTPNTNTGANKDTATYKAKKAMTLKIVTCNFVGSPTANAKYVYTYGT
jgi:hypothetical protein